MNSKGPELYSILSKFAQTIVRSNVWELDINNCIKRIEKLYEKEHNDE